MRRKKHRKKVQHTVINNFKVAKSKIWNNFEQIKATFTKKSKTDYTQAMPATIWCNLWSYFLFSNNIQINTYRITLF